MEKNLHVRRLYLAPIRNSGALEEYGSLRVGS